MDDAIKLVTMLDGSNLEPELDVAVSVEDMLINGGRFKAT